MAKKGFSFDALVTETLEHHDNQDNPHNVDADQVGLGNLPNEITDSVTDGSRNKLATAKAVQTVHFNVEDAHSRIDDISADIVGQFKHLGAVDLSSGKYPPKPEFSAIWHVTKGGIVDEETHVATASTESSEEYEDGDSLVFSLDLDKFYKVEDKSSISYDEAHDTFLKKEDRAADSAKLDGKTRSEIITEARSDRVPNTRRVAGKELKDDITLARSDVGLSNVDNVKQAAQTIQIIAGTNCTGGGTLAENRTINVPNASTTARGAVQLNDATNSTKTDEAATANAAKKAYDRGSSGITKADAAQADITAHVGKKDNPHGTTKSHVGLSNVTNVKQAAESIQIIAGTNCTGGGTLADNRTINVPNASTTARGAVQLNDATNSTKTDEAATANAAKKAYDRGSSGITDAAAAKKVADDHIAKKDNPHGTTKSHVGLSNVDNVKQLPLSGGTMTGDLNVNAHVKFQSKHVAGSASVDFNNYVESGHYDIANLGDSKNKPPLDHCTLEVSGNASRYVVQVATERTTNKQCFRTAHKNGSADRTWTAWVELYSKTHRPSKTDVGLSNVDNVKQAAQSIQIIAGTNCTGGGTLAENRTINVPNASTTARGAVQLNDATNSTKTDEAATANAAKKAYDRGSSGITKADAAQADITAHVGKKDNPHGTTKSHVGLSNVTNVKQAAESIQIIAGTNCTGGGTLAENRTINVPNASTTARGAVQLNDATNSTKTDEAATANAAKKAYDRGSSGITDAAAAKKVADDHIAKKDNPHSTTKSHVGLSNVDNVKQAAQTIQIIAGTNCTGGGTLAENRTINVPNASTTARGAVQLNDATNSTKTDEAATANAAKKAYDRGSSGITKADAAQADITAHVGKKDNPHGTTKSHVGLSNVTNVKQAAESIQIIAGTNCTGGGTLAENRTINVPNASTTARGAVQLNDATNSTAKDQAATPNALKNVNDRINGLTQGWQQVGFLSKKAGNNVDLLVNTNPDLVVTRRSVGVYRITSKTGKQIYGLAQVGGSGDSSCTAHCATDDDGSYISIRTFHANDMNSRDSEWTAVVCTVE